MQADEQGNVIHVTAEQEQAMRAARLLRSRQCDYRERGAALYAIAKLMMRKGISAVEAQNEKHGKARYDEMILLSQQSGDLTLDEYTIMGLLFCPVETLLEDIDAQIVELEAETKEAIADDLKEQELVTRMRED